MSSGRSRIVDIAAEFRMERGKGIAIWDGERERGKEAWTWLPAALVEDNGDGTFAMPEWLARDKGLI